MIDRNCRHTSTVAIVKVIDGDVESGVKKIFELVGGLDTIVAPLDTVILKPNLATDKHYSTGAVTNTQVLKACSNCITKVGARKIYIGDSSVIGTKTEDVIRINGLDELVSKRVEIIDFRKSEYENVVIPNALKYRRLAFPKEVLNSDVIVNIPVMKTHDIMEVTLGFKNMKGLIKDSTKRRFHSIGVEEGVIDTTRVALADFTLIDGTFAMEGNGPLEGTPVGLNLLIGSKDALAAEVVAIKVMGFEPEKMEYIHMAYNAGFGENDLDKIEIVGEKIEDVIHTFIPAYKERILPENIRISDEHACSACRNRLTMLMKQKFWSDDEVSSKKWHIYAGDVNYDELRDDELNIFVGKCLIQNKDKCNIYVPGCPPGPNSIQQEIKAMFNSNKL